MVLRKFRFHLSTALLLMIAAGGLIGLNLHQRFNKFGFTVRSGGWDVEACYGFPMSARVIKGTLWEHITQAEFDQQQHDRNDPRQEFYDSARVIPGRGVFNVANPTISSPIGISVDLLFALTVLFLVALISEHMIHRKKKSKENQPAIN